MSAIPDQAVWENFPSFFPTETQWFDQIYNRLNPVFQTLQDIVFKRPLLCATVTIAFGYIVWYWVFIVRKPVVYGGSGRLRHHLLTHCPIFTDFYWPTCWAVNRHVCTITRAAFQRQPDMKYERQTLTLPDGGELALDWAVCESIKPNSPIFLILPGLTGNCYLNYILHFVQDGLSKGYRPVVFNQRGTGGFPLKTPRLYSATNTEDLECVIESINLLYPGTPILATGVSLGGIILTRYLSRHGSHSKISAAITISTPMEPFSSKKSLETKWFNKRVYIDFLVQRLKVIIEDNVHVLERHPSVDRGRMRRISSLSEFDDVITAPTFGYSSSTEYYADACLTKRLNDIKVPYLCLMSSDDPFAPLEHYPTTEFNSNSNTILILTKHGGHFGFLEGLYPRGSTWMNRVTQQYLDAMKIFMNT